MSLTDKIKDLVADGKTQAALDLLQKFLKDRDAELLNQTFLLENQYKDLQKRMQLGLQDAASEVNRVNFTLLNLCDDAEKLEKTTAETAQNAENTEGVQINKSIIKNAGWIMAAIAGLAVLIIGGLVFLKKDDSKALPIAPLSTVPSASVVVEPTKMWRSLPDILTINQRLYGNLKIKIQNIKNETFDASRDLVNFTLQLNCIKSYSGKCITPYLRYNLMLPTGEKLENEDLSEIPQNISDGLATTLVLSFVVPKNLTAGELQIFYAEEPQSKASVKIEVIR